MWNLSNLKQYYPNNLNFLNYKGDPWSLKAVNCATHIFKLNWAMNLGHVSGKKKVLVPIHKPKF